MYKSKKVLGIIPARGGSKGIPLKNIVKLGEKPLIQYTIDQCKSSKLLTKFVVSTDNEKIANVALDLGAEVVRRPTEISKDNSRTEECLIHCLCLMESKGELFDYVAILEPTSPFRKYETIDESIKFLIDENKNSLLTCKSSTENIGELKNGNIFKPLIPENPRRRQERIPLFIESSTIYIVKSNYLIETKSIVSKEWLVKIIDPLEAIDINTQLDLNYAKFLLSKKN
tara:strand:+ start:4792 stop:5475 length:684 start_codon:yes stop_codon:yes gene_type:complete